MYIIDLTYAHHHLSAARSYLRGHLDSLDAVGEIYTRERKLIDDLIQGLDCLIDRTITLK